MAVHNFNITIAERYGIESAIIIEHLYWWIHKNECEEIEDMYHEGRVWCRSTAKGFAKYIPYMKPDKIWRILRKLEGHVLMVGNFNKKALNQTLWYTFTDDFKKELIKLDYDFENFKNAILKNEKSNNSIINNPINKENKITEYKEKRLSNDNQKKDDYSEEFKQFWKLYNYPKDKKTAYSRWNHLSQEDKEQAIKAIPAYFEDCARCRRSKQHPSTYLSKRTFEDDFTVNDKIGFYDLLETDSDEKQRFKAWMRKEHPEIEDTALPLSYEDYMMLVSDEEYGSVDGVEDALRKIEGEIWKYRKCDIAHIVRRFLEGESV